MADFELFRRRRLRDLVRSKGRLSLVAVFLLVWLVQDLLASSKPCFVELHPASKLERLPPRSRHGLRAVQQSEQEVKKLDKDSLDFETQKFNMAWVRMKDAQEQSSGSLAELAFLAELRQEVEEQGKIVEELGGSLPAEMMTLEQAEAKAAKLKSELSFENLMKISNDERWILAKSIGPAFPISLVLSYTLYWVLNIPFIAFAYYTTVLTGQTTMGVVMAGAYATSIPFKPLVYIGALLVSPWTAETIMPPIGRAFGFFKLPDGDDFDRL
ncbi:unnamed protein product [Polarella glacialis]|uniref:Uncharacterized protein n=1 Tax=Polarella glacialis TaxID=89957 RepID=A0A813KTA9_POLGL|nr:unnamed protein product [Polarella glacialis]|mmetsp:Transcript_63710/g.114679  ORF Transcript_63710/g.114679 Transcript_63710/m.114679 type:complete len:270 (+) Transcript_63710:63-872(+)